MFTVNKNPTPSDLRKFGRAMLIGFGVIGVLLWIVQWRSVEGASLVQWTGGWRQILAVCFWTLGLILCSISLTSAGITRAIYIFWMSVTMPIGIVMGTIMLTLMFFLLLPVFSLIVRWGDPMRKKLTSDKSYWEEHKPVDATLERMARLF